MLFRINTFSDKQRVKDHIDQLPDRRYEVAINVHHDKRTYSQNRLMWLWYACICKETEGEYDSEELHNYFKEKFLKKRTISVFGEEMEGTMSTKNLNTLEFKEYLDKIQRFASGELGIILPLPSDYVFPEFEDQYKDKI